MYTFAKKWTLLLRSAGLRYVDGEYVIFAKFSLFSAKMKDEKNHVRSFNLCLFKDRLKCYFQ